MNVDLTGSWEQLALSAAPIIKSPDTPVFAVIVALLLVGISGYTRFADPLHHPRRPCSHVEGCPFWDEAYADDDDDAPAPQPIQAGYVILAGAPAAQKPKPLPAKTWHSWYRRLSIEGKVAVWVVGSIAAWASLVTLAPLVCMSTWLLYKAGSDYRSCTCEHKRHAGCDGSSEAYYRPPSGHDGGIFKTVGRVPGYESADGTFVAGVRRRAAS